MRLRYFAALLAMALIGLLAGGVPAQEVYCSTLSRADCVLYYREGSTLPDSSSIKMTMELTLGPPGGGALDFTLTASGSYKANSDQVNIINNFVDSYQPDDILPLEDFRTALDAIFNVADADLQLSLSVPSELLSFRQPDKIDMDLWFIGGVGYVDLTSIGDFVADPSLDGTFGFDLAQATNFGLSFLDEALWNDLQEEALAAAPADDVVTLQLSEQLLLNETTVISSEAVGNATEFTLTVDWLSLLELPVARDQIVASVTTLTPREVNAVLDGLIETVVTDGVVVQEQVDTATGRSTSITLDTVMAIDTNRFADIYADATDDFSVYDLAVGDLDVGVQVRIDRFDFEAVESIAPPPGARIISIFELFGLFDAQSI
ncbi:MAG: hypothetical protein AAF125_15235 [Chloroflexota bacterium]